MATAPLSPCAFGNVLGLGGPLPLRKPSLLTPRGLWPRGQLSHHSVWAWSHLDCLLPGCAGVSFSRACDGLLWLEHLTLSPTLDPRLPLSLQGRSEHFVGSKPGWPCSWSGQDACGPRLLPETVAGRDTFVSQSVTRVAVCVDGGQPTPAPRSCLYFGPSTQSWWPARRGHTPCPVPFPGQQLGLSRWG